MPHINVCWNAVWHFDFDTLTPKGVKWGLEVGILRVKRHEGVGYYLLGSDTAVCGILVGEKAE